MKSLNDYIKELEDKVTEMITYTDVTGTEGLILITTLRQIKENHKSAKR